MKVLIAMDSFKESMTAEEACMAVEEGIRKVYDDAECLHFPMADGGEGTARILSKRVPSEEVRVMVHGPLGEAQEAVYYVTEDGETAFMEMAASSGLELVPREKRNPLITTTYGVGEMMMSALDRNVKNIVLGIGGSATNDAGAGMLMALGVRLLDQEGNSIGNGGGALERLARLDMEGVDRRLKDVNLEVACDVRNTLTGKNGASHVFGPQKGADPGMVLYLDENLRHFAHVVKKDLGIELLHLEGGGAAGGLGSALIGILGAAKREGIELVMTYSKFCESLVDADLVFTGEGSIDAQSFEGKVPIGIGKASKEAGVPVIALAGRVPTDLDRIYDYVDAVFSIVPGVYTLEDALRDGRKNLVATVQNIMKLVRMFCTAGT